MSKRGDLSKVGAVGRMRAAIESLERTQRELAPIEAMQDWRLRAKGTYIRRQSTRPPADK